MHKRITKLITSRKFAAVMLVISTAFVFLGLLIPQEDDAQAMEWFSKNPTLFKLATFFRFTMVYNFWTPLFLAILAVSILLCNLERWQRESRLIPQGKKIWFEVEKEPSEMLAVTERTLRRSFFWVRIFPKRDETEIIAKRNVRLGGSFFFHFGLILILLGGFTSRLFGFQGAVNAGEGEIVQLNRESFRSHQKGLFFTLVEFPFAVFCRDIRVDYERNEASRVIIDGFFSEDQRKTPMRIEVNKPSYYQGVKFLIKELGFAPKIVIYDQKGEALVDGYVKFFNNLDFGAADFVQVGGDKFEFVVFPNQNKQQPFLIDEPVLKVKLINQGKAISTSNIPLNGSRKVGSYQVSFTDVVYWVNLYLSKDAGYFISVAGSLAALVGFLLVLAGSDQRLVLTIKKRRRKSEIGLACAERAYFPRKQPIMERVKERLFQQLG